MVTPLDPRVVKGPDKFNGRDWVEWSFVFRAFIGVLRLFTAVELEEAENQKQMIKLADLQPEVRERASGLWYLLSQFLTGNPLRVLQKCESGNGLEGWRELSNHYSKSGAAAKTGQLHQLMAFDFGSDMHTFSERITEWDLMLASYHAAVGVDELPDDVLKTLVIQGAPEPLKTHLQVADPTISFSSLRAVVANFLKARDSWQQHESTSPTSMPMEVSHVKGKGKGKDKGKGKSSTKSNGFSWCLRCGKFGHRMEQCTAAIGSNDWEDDDNSGVTTNWNIQCWSCWGWGHKENVCPSKGHGKGSVPIMTLFGDDSVLDAGTAAVGGCEPGTSAAGVSGSSEAGFIRGGVADLPEMIAARGEISDMDDELASWDLHTVF